MFNKTTTFEVGKNEVEILDGDLLKTAALKLPDGINYDPDFLYMKVRAVSAGEYFGCNKNADFFPEEELKANYKTFLTAHTFKNHENKDIKNAIGDVLAAEWNDTMKGVDLLLRIDRRVAPTIVRGFEKGFMTDVSMGCRIAYSVCSICGNKAKTKYDYCEHIKYQRNKVLDDGRRVYEINIGPKFHDISAVLNGAEKVAKATGIYIIGSKVAFSEDMDIEKVANFKDVFSTEKVANELKPQIDKTDTIDLDMNQYKKKDKTEYIQKIAELKKDLQCRILGIAEGEFTRDRQENIEEVANILKLFYTEYWDKDKCYDIANRIKYIANKRNVPIEVAFYQFLKVLDFAGIELTPLELHDICSAITEISSPDVRLLEAPSISKSEIPSFVNNIDKIIGEHGLNKFMNFPTLFKTVNDNFIPNRDKIIKVINGADNGLGKTKAIIIRMKKKVPVVNDDVVMNDVMDNIVKELMPNRSCHRRFLVPRVINIAEDKNVKMYPENINHFVPIQLLANNSPNDLESVLPYLISGLMYSTYQNDRVDNFNNGELAYGVKKYAYEIYGPSMETIANRYCIDKTASKKQPKITFGKSVTVGVPIIYGYSAYQRSRIRNGKRVSDLNRYVAENPGSAALLQIAFTPAVNKGLGKIKDVNLVTPNGFDNYLYRKYASEETCEEYAIDKLSKTLYNNDIFKDKNIDASMLKEYSNNQLNAIKQACVLTSMDRQDLANDLLFKNGIAEDDLAKYLKTAVDCIKIEFEKNASSKETKEVLIDSKNDIIIGKPQVIFDNITPDNLFDSIIFSQLDGKKLLKNKDINRKECFENGREKK